MLPLAKLVLSDVKILYISTPPPHPRKVENLAQFLEIHAEWARKQVPSEGETGFLSQLW
jgi:hypothetical protein